MQARKKKRLEDAGWRVGSTQEFLGLSPADAAYIELKIALSGKLKECRQVSSGPSMIAADVSTRDPD